MADLSHPPVEFAHPPRAPFRVTKGSSSPTVSDARASAPEPGGTVPCFVLCVTFADEFAQSPGEAVTVVVSPT